MIAALILAATQFAESTSELQDRIDAAWRAGGGEVLLEAGEYRLNPVRLRSGVILRLASGAHVYGNADCNAYVGALACEPLEPISETELKQVAGEDLARRSQYALFYAFRAHDVSVVAEPGSSVNGVNCPDPLGAEGYRGPHVFWFACSTNVVFSGVRVEEAGDYAFKFVNCDNVSMRDVSAAGGHDGVHFDLCRKVRIVGSTFETGDDSVAGSGCSDVVVSNCTLNSACSPLRLGGRNVLVTDCRVTGPAKHPHRWTLTREEKLRGARTDEVAGRRTVGAFFQGYTGDVAHRGFSPGNMVVRNTTVENVERFLLSVSGLPGALWQDGRGISDLTFENVRATGLGKPAVVVAKSDCPMTLTLRNCSFDFRDPQDAAFVGQNVRIVDEGVRLLNAARLSVEKTVTYDDVPDFPSWRRETAEQRREWGLPPLSAQSDYDLVVLGDGPGALTAAYAAGRKQLRVCWVRGTDDMAIPRCGERQTLNLGPMFRLSYPMFHLMTFEDTPNMLLNEMHAFTNLTICVRRDAGVFERSPDGSIESYGFLAGTNRMTVTGRVWADGGQLNRTGDGQLVELDDLVNHRESMEGTVTVAGDFPELHFVPFGAFLVRDTPNLIVATRRFGVTAEAKAALALSDETDAQAGALAACVAHAAKMLRVPLSDFAFVDKKFLSLTWENLLTGNGWGGGSMKMVGWENYDRRRLGFSGTAARRPQEVLKCVREGDKWIIPAGDYYLDEPLVFTADDSGTSENPAVYEARGKVNISAGRTLAGWRVTEGGVWRAEVPWAKTNPFRQLSVNGALRPRARHPNKGFFTAKKDDLPDEYSQSSGARWRLFFREGDFDPSWKNLSSGEIVSYALWTDTHLKIQGVDAAEQSILFRYPSAKSLWGTDKKWWGTPLYRIENIYEIMDEAGEWCLDKDVGAVFYRPLPGETPENVKVVAPCHERAVVFRGEPGRPCANVILRGVRITDANYDLPPGEVNDMQASVVVSAAVLMTEACACALEDCTVENVSGYAVEMRGATRDCAVRRCRLVHLGAGGVHLQGANWNEPMNRRAIGCEVSDCEIGDYGRDFASAVGILLRVAEDCKIVHNHVHDGYYTGISVGWNWGYSNVSTRNNLIAWNHIHDIGKHVLSDMGGIYTLGVQPGTVLRGNVIHDVQVRAYGGWGIYNDEGSSGILVEKNLVYDVRHGGYNLNYGRGNTVRNNVFAFGEEYQLRLVSTCAEPHFSTYFCNNIVHWDTGTLDRYDYKSGVPGIERLFSDYNLYSGLGARRLRETHPEIGPRGVIDQHSVWADAQFADAGKRDFRLKTGSPAIALGFEPVDWSVAGPRE